MLMEEDHLGCLLHRQSKVTARLEWANQNVDHHHPMRNVLREYALSIQLSCVNEDPNISIPKWLLGWV